MRWRIANILDAHGKGLSSLRDHKVRQILADAVEKFTLDIAGAEVDGC